MGDRLNLSNVAIVMLLIGWGLLWGAPGLFLAIPLSVSILLAMAQFPAGRPFAILLSKTGRLRRDDRVLRGDVPPGTALASARADAASMPPAAR